MNKYYKQFEEDIQDFNKNPNNYPEEDKAEEALEASEDENEEDEGSESEDEEDEDEKPVKASKPIKKISSDYVHKFFFRHLAGLPDGAQTLHMHQRILSISGEEEEIAMVSQANSSFKVCSTFLIQKGDVPNSKENSSGAIHSGEKKKA